MKEVIIKLTSDHIKVKGTEEVWADVVGYEGLYQISNQARVRNRKGDIMGQSIKRGRNTNYKYVKLYKDGRYETRYIHRLVGECFIPNPDNLPLINHKDEDGTNNRVENLEWCTTKYNNNYGNAPQRSREKKIGAVLSEEHKRNISDGVKRYWAERKRNDRDNCEI